MARKWHRWLAERGSDASPSPGERAPRRIAVGDVHGCRRTLSALLDTVVAVEPGDSIYLLGDLIAKGPDSRGVLEFVMELRERGVTVVIIRGNHEHDLLEAVAGSPKALSRYIKRSGTADLLAPDGADTLDEALYRCLWDSHYYVALPEALLVHGGFDFDQEDPFGDAETMVSIRSFDWSRERTGGRPIIHGHVATRLSVILERVADYAAIIPLDNGVVRDDEASGLSEFGNLCALDLDSFDLYIQPNLDIDPSHAPYGLVATPHAPRPTTL